MSAELRNTVQARELLKKYREQMVKDPNSSWLSPVICKATEEIDRLTEAIEAAIKRGDYSVKDLMTLLDYK